MVGEAAGLEEVATFSESANVRRPPGKPLDESSPAVFARARGLKYFQTDAAAMVNVLEAFVEIAARSSLQDLQATKDNLVVEPSANSRGAMK